MSSSLLEQTRSLHEDLEVLERAMYRELGDPSTAKLRRADEIARDQVVATMLEAHTSRSAQLARLYEDDDGARKDELAAMSGSGVFNQFYDQVRSPRLSSPCGARRMARRGGAHARSTARSAPQRHHHGRHAGADRSLSLCVCAIPSGRRS